MKTAVGRFGELDWRLLLVSWAGAVNDWCWSSQNNLNIVWPSGPLLMDPSVSQNEIYFVWSSSVYLDWRRACDMYCSGVSLITVSFVSQQLLTLMLLLCALTPPNTAPLCERHVKGAVVRVPPLWICIPQGLLGEFNKLLMFLENGGVWDSFTKVNFRPGAAEVRV